LVEYAHQASERQAEQNKAMAEQSQAVIRENHQVTAAAQELVQQDALARRELIQAQDHIQQQNHTERSTLDRLRESLAQDQKESAQAAVRDPVIAAALVTIGLALAALLPLLVTALALHKLPADDRADLEIVEAALRSGSTGQPLGLLDHIKPSVAGDDAPRLAGQSDVIA
jgi:hypothetical protein